jgi:hypothetical protein
MQSPVLTLLRRLEAQNVWRMTYNVMPQQAYSSTTAAAVQPMEGTTPASSISAAELSKEWYDDSNLSAQDALKLLVDRIRISGPVSTSSSHSSTYS